MRPSLRANGSRERVMLQCRPRLVRNCAREREPITTDACRCVRRGPSFGLAMNIVVMGPGSRSLRSLVRDDVDRMWRDNSRFNFQTVNDSSVDGASFRGDAKHRTPNLEIPGLVLRTIPE